MSSADNVPLKCSVLYEAAYFGLFMLTMNLSEANEKVILEPWKPQ